MLEKRNYEHNRKIDLESAYPGGYINGQGVGAVSEMMYGINHMSWNGCEMIAIYNAMHRIGKHVELRDVAREMYPISQVAMGFFGSNVYVLGRYFKRHGIPYTPILSYNNFFNQIREHKCGVCSFWNRRILFGSLHTVMVEFRDGKYVVYNRTNGRTEPAELSFRGNITSKKLFIIGYLID